MGRPIEYRENYIDKVEEYLESRQDTSQGLTFKVKLPTIEGFALFLGHHKDTLYDWAKKYPLFSDALRKIKTEQYQRLVDSGLSGAYNSTIAKLILSSNHGLSEKQIIENKINLHLEPEKKKEIDNLIDIN